MGSILNGARFPGKSDALNDSGGTPDGILWKCEEVREKCLLWFIVIDNTFLFMLLYVCLHFYNRL